jgi:hypothetical protein
MSRHPAAASGRPPLSPPRTQPDPANPPDIGGIKPSVTFRVRRIADENWQITVSCPSLETEYTISFSSRIEAAQWLASESSTWTLGMTGQTAGSLIIEEDGAPALERNSVPGRAPRTESAA